MPCLSCRAPDRSRTSRCRWTRSPPAWEVPRTPRACTPRTRPRPCVVERTCLEPPCPVESNRRDHTYDLYVCKVASMPRRTAEEAAATRVQLLAVARDLFATD